MSLYLIGPRGVTVPFVEVPVVACPACGAIAADWDGFGLLTCTACGYCTHPSMTGTETGEWQCDNCGRLVV